MENLEKTKRQHFSNDSLVKTQWWWQLVKLKPMLRKPCVTMVRLLCSTSSLRVHCDTDTPRELRICLLCDSGQMEDTYHFVMSCNVHSNARLRLLESICQNVSCQTINVLTQLSDQMLFYIFMGLEFPLCLEDKISIRSLCCISVHRMYQYNLRLKWSDAHNA